MTMFDTCGPTQTPDDIDIDALREKYLHERDKRLRPKGRRNISNSRTISRSSTEVDPYTPMIPATPIDENVEVAVLGGGIAGLLAGAYLKKAGVDDVRVIEMAGDFGGVWYWNRFPGIQCDNDAYCYIPMLEELGFMPNEEVLRRRRDLRALSTHRQAIRPLRRGGFPYPGTHGALGRRDQALAADHESRRRHPCAVRGHGAGLIQPAEAARNPRHQGLREHRRPRVPFRALGLRLYRRRCQRRAAQAGTTNASHSSARGLPASSWCHTWSRCPAPLRVPADAVIGRRARQPPTDPQWAKSLQPGWQEERKRNFHSWSPFGTGSPSANRIWSATSGPNSAAT